jgi:hypothetical protein
MDWIHTKPPFGVPVRIFDHYGQVRSGIREGYYVRWLDCTDPMANSAYPADMVVAWKPAG